MAGTRGHAPTSSSRLPSLHSARCSCWQTPLDTGIQTGNHLLEQLVQHGAELHGSSTAAVREQLKRQHNVPNRPAAHSKLTGGEVKALCQSDH